MHIIILKNNLKESLTAVSGARKENSQLPILKNILLETKEDKLFISSTDLDIAIVQSVSAKILQEGKITVPFGVFFQIISNLSSERVEMELKGGALVITTDNYKAKIGTMSADDFPIIPSVSKEKASVIGIEKDVLLDALGGVITACHISDFRPELSGVLLHIKDGSLHVVATDSFRLAKKQIASKKIESTCEDGFSCIVPLRTAQECMRIFSSHNGQAVRLYIDGVQLLCEGDGLQLTSRLIEGKFPDYQLVIPKECDAEIILQKDDLTTALRLTSSLANRLNEVRLSIGDDLKHVTLVTASQEFGESEYLLPAKIHGQPMHISFNWRFILDGLKNIKTQQVRIGLNGEHKPSIMQAPDDEAFLYVLTSIKSG